MKNENNLSWKSYAQKYDMLLSYNPYYQQLNKDVLNATSEWKVDNEDVMVDLGAGTGNYSIPLARNFPQAKIYHIDSDEGMNVEARCKQKSKGIKNHHIMQKNVEDVEFKPGTINYLISVHALYTFPQPQDVIRNIYQWLAPGGKAILVDAGRPVNVLSWQLAIGAYLIWNYGLKETLSIMKEGKEVRYQNAQIRKLQKKGFFWTHSHKEFCDVIENAGFIIQNSFETFRDVSDFVVAEKPKRFRNPHSTSSNDDKSYHCLNETHK